MDNEPENTFWSKTKEIIENSTNQNIPSCVQHILNRCGYNHFLSWKIFSTDDLSIIEDWMRKPNNISSIRNFNCTLQMCTVAHYKDQTNFELIPGHRSLIISIAECLKEHISKGHDQYMQAEARKNIQPFLYENPDFFCKIVEEHPGFSVILKQIIVTAITNERRPKNHAVYSDMMKHLATYLFCQSGRSCYTFLYKNLPLPSISTVRK